jgi:hypothetical protein
MTGMITENAVVAATSAKTMVQEVMPAAVEITGMPGEETTVAATGITEAETLVVVMAAATGITTVILRRDIKNVLIC